MLTQDDPRSTRIHRAHETGTCCTSLFRLSRASWGLPCWQFAEKFWVFPYPPVNLHRCGKAMICRSFSLHGCSTSMLVYPRVIYINYIYNYIYMLIYWKWRVSTKFKILCQNGEPNRKPCRFVAFGLNPIENHADLLHLDWTQCRFVAFGSCAGSYKPSQRTRDMTVGLPH